MLVTGSRKGRRVSGHLSEIRSRSMARSSESALAEEPARVRCCRVFREDAAVGDLAEALVSSRWANQVEGCGRGGMASLGCLESWMMR